MNSSSIILAIAPGNREFGIAIFAGTELFYYSVKTLNPKNNLPEQVSGLLKKFFRWFTPRVVVLKSINQYQKLSKNLEIIVKQIEFEARQKELQIVEISFEQIKRALYRNGKSTQKSALKSLINDYPELKRFWNRPNKWQNDYYSFLFSAVAVGAIYLKTLSRKD